MVVPKFTVIRDIVAVNLQADLPTIIWSDPGQGKTSFAGQLSRILHKELVVVIGSLREPQDFLGIPVLGEGFLVDMAPPRLADVLSRDNTLLLIDELTTCNQQIQAALLRIINERCMGEIKLRCRILCAANPPGEAVGGMDLYRAMANRMIHLNWEMTAADYAYGMRSGWQYEVPVLPDDWHDLIPGEVEAGTKFLSDFKPNLLNFKPADGEYAFATPRTWDFAWRYVAACKAANLSGEHLLMGLRGCVGSGPAVEYKEYLDLQVGPDPMLIVADPAKNLPALKQERMDLQTSVFNWIAKNVGQHNSLDAKRFHTIIQAALGYGFEPGLLMSTLQMATPNLPREHAVAIERAIRKHTEKWEGSGRT